MTDNFIAIDVETANHSRASICQIGLAAYAGSNLCWKWSSLVNPEEDFDQKFVDLHGITSLRIQSAPTFPAIVAAISNSIDGQFIASHTSFDCNALSEAAKKYGVRLPHSSWIDTCEISRLAWPHLPNHKLNTLCQHFAIELDHHDAGSDAIACGEILCHAVLETRLLVPQLVERVGVVTPAPQRAPRSPVRYPERINLGGAKDGPLSGHVLVCTGEFVVGKSGLSMIAAELGCGVEDRFSKKRTTILVVGRRDPSKYNGKAKSKKQLDAEAAIAAGRPIQIFNEIEFMDYAKQFEPARANKLQ